MAPTPAGNIEDKLEEMEKERRKITKNKATEKGLKYLMSRIAKAKEELVRATQRKHGQGFFVKKTGDRTVALMGFPSAGKSSLLNALANTSSKIAAYEFTTTSIIPGTMVYRNAHIQVLDMPGIIEEAHLGAGGGRTVIAAAKGVNLMLIVLDINKPGDLDIILDEIKDMGIRLNRKKPSVIVNSKQSGGIKIEKNESSISRQHIEAVLKEFGVHSATVSIGDELDEEELIEIISNRAMYASAVVALNKIDTRPDYEEVAGQISHKYGIKVVPISVTEGININVLKEVIYDNLNIISVYLQPKDKYEKPVPFILTKGATVADAASKLHTEIFDELKCAYVSGPSAKFRRQRVGAMHILMEGDTVTFITKK